MKLKVFTIWDAKAEAFNTPFFLPMRGQAVRSFSDECTREGSEFAKHPEDYTLFEVGEFDADSGKLESHTAPEPVAKALDYVGASVQ